MYCRAHQQRSRQPKSKEERTEKNRTEFRIELRKAETRMQRTPKLHTDLAGVFWPLDDAKRSMKNKNEKKKTKAKDILFIWLN